MSAMDKWINQLQDASFRGMAVHIDSIRASGGPQVVVREYPFSDLPTFHSTGLKGERFNLNLYVYGVDYLAQSERLIDLLNQPGPGTLAHPWGSVEVVLENGWEYEISASKLGCVRFTCTFVKAEERRYPKVTINRRAAAAQAIATSRTASVEAFAEAFSVDDQPGWVLDSAAEAIDQAVAALEESVTGGLGSLNGPESSVLDFLDTASDIKNNVATLIQAPATLGGRLMGLFNSGSSALNGFKGVFNGFSSVAKFAVKPNVNSGSTYIAGTPTPSRLQQQNNTQAVETLVQSAALASASEAVINRTEAPATRAEINDTELTLATGYENLLAKTDNATAYQATTDSYTATLAMLQQQKPAAAQLDTVTPAQTLPAKVLSYQLYGTGQYDDELVSRNGVDNPLFVPGGRELEVIRHG